MKKIKAKTVLGVLLSIGNQLTHVYCNTMLIENKYGRLLNIQTITYITQLLCCFLVDNLASRVYNSIHQKTLKPQKCCVYCTDVGFIDRSRVYVLLNYMRGTIYLELVLCSCSCCVKNEKVWRSNFN